MSEGKWCYSFNEENFEGDFDTRDDAIGEGLYYYEEDNQSELYVGQAQEVSLGVNIDFIVEQLGEDAYEQCGEVAEDYLCNVKSEHREILEDKMNDVLQKWMDEFKYNPTFYTVGNVEKVK
ncbi:hypothetical protein [Halalkalibacter oceani]|uniref:hypothetical protein n=1 Tax=Halalkalibacter oceani TaxID=1653776 RepID=UPI003398665F